MQYEGGSKCMSQRCPVRFPCSHVLMLDILVCGQMIHVYKKTRIGNHAYCYDAFNNW